MPRFARGPGGQHTRLPPRMAGVWDAAGIDIVSSNHAMDWGPEAMLDTIELFQWVSDQHPHWFRVEGGEVVVDTAA